MIELNKIISELIGSFFFFSVILGTTEAIPIGITLIAVIYLIGPLSGGHVNPITSLLMYEKGNIDQITLFAYIMVQLIGSYLAYKWWSGNNKLIDQ